LGSLSRVHGIAGHYCWGILEFWGYVIIFILPQTKSYQTTLSTNYGISLKEAEMRRFVSILTIVFLHILFLEVVVFSSSAQAQTSAHVHEVHTAPDRSFKEIWNRDKLTGDWGGMRTDLTDHGIDIDLRLSQYGQGVASGGVDQNGEYGGTMDYRVNLDGPKLFGSWDGFSVNMHARTRFGQDVSADAGALAFQNLGMLMPLPGGYHATDITGLTVSQYLPFFGGVANVTLGKLDIVDLLTGFFPNLSYGQEGFSNLNSTIPALPWFGAVRGLSLYGGYGATINQKYKMIQSGFLATGTKNVSTSWSSISDSFDEGAWLAGFHRLFWELDDKMGYFMVFVGGSTADQASNDPLDFVVIPGQGIESAKRKKPWDIALYVYQDFWQAKGNPNRKATFFMGGTVGPDNPQFAQYSLSANVEAFGLVASRPHDRMGVAGWHSWLSDNFKDLASPVTDLRNTWGFELYYNFAINKWLHLSPGLQLVKNERAADDLAVIPGVRLVMDF
jgi:porin